MYIKILKWLSVSSQEAELTVTDDNYSCLAFSQPCNYKQGDILHEPLHGFIVENLMLSNKQEFRIDNIKNFQHKIIARIINFDEDLVEVGDIHIKLDDNIPSWAKDGDYIEFNCSRLDIW